jgi:signal transduction histidine kinase/CHASE3 domain sensor protein
MIFYGWAGLVVQTVLAAGVIAFVLAGAAGQRSAIVELHRRAQAAQVANLAMLADFLDAERAARGYQVTGEPEFLRTYHTAQDEFEEAFRQVRRLVRPPLTGSVRAAARSARSVFAVGDKAVAAPAGSTAAARFFARASAGVGVFTGQAERLRRRLARQTDVLVARSERVLGVGLGWTGVILAISLAFPVLSVAVAWRWVSGHLHTATTAVRRRALGDSEARVVAAGPAEVRDLATSVNFLADESDRLRAAERERARLQAEVRQASVRIREHLHGAAIIREAMTAIHEHLAVDFVWVGIVNDERLTLADGDPDVWGQAADIVGYFPPDSVGWIRDVYRHRSSYRVQDLRKAQVEEIPAEIKKILISQGATSLLLTPFGAGQELLGCLTLLRTGPGQGWTEPQIEAVESLAGDIGRGLEHARLYESEERLVAELESLDHAKTSFLASVSHDLRTPLTSIIGYLEMLCDDEPGQDRSSQVMMLDAVDRNARRLQTMIEDLLTISKIELGAFTSRLHPLDLTGLVPAAAEVIRPSAAAGGLDFQVSCPDHDLMIDGDPEQLDRVLVNLLSNAVKYTPSGGSVALEMKKAGDSVVTTITDTGIGIPEKDQSSMFTRFFRASNAVEAAIPGSGLGLSISATIVAHHGGDLSVESAHNRGTTVTVRIPLRGSAHAAGLAHREDLPGPAVP